MRFLTLILLSGLLMNCANIVDPLPADCSKSTMRLDFDSSSPTTGCNTADGSFQVTASGGEGEYLYRTEGVDLQVSGLFESLEAGFYTVEVIDAIGCSAIVNASIGSGAGISIEEVITTNTECNQLDGTISVTVNGGVNVKYKINGGVFGANNVFTGLQAGQYTVSVTDNSGCEITATAMVEAQIPYAQIRSILDANCSVAGCHDGSSNKVDLSIDTNVAAFANDIKTRTGKKTMPLRSSGLKLTAEEIEKIACWVDNGSDINN